MRSQSERSSGFRIDGDIFENSMVHTNTDQEIIVVTEDKLWRCLRSHQDLLKAKNDWLAPAGIFCTLVATLFAADFTTFVVEASVWNAMYIMAALLSFGWLLISVKNAYSHRNEGDIEGIIKILKTETNQKNE